MNELDNSVVVVDYGVGNLGSVVNMLKKAGASNIVLTDNHDEILAANKIILPGVGSFDHGMRRLRETGTDQVLLDAANSRKEILGICLGMQLLTEGSEEGTLPGLGLVSGYAKQLPKETSRDLKIPHMGWNIVKPMKKHYLLDELPSESRYYFVHSYFVECTDTRDILLTTHYGMDFVSSFQKNNVIGCQFHPEKSHRFGLQLFSNFVREPIC